MISSPVRYNISITQQGEHCHGKHEGAVLLA